MVSSKVLFLSYYLSIHITLGQVIWRHGINFHDYTDDK
uniref:Uncharacterized protein n=1 Tax=Anguilla anguilla TaxID=7936 RepID=A0A0E9Q0W0_ANGAN